METLKKYLKRYFIDAMGAMSLGLFASLLIGTIFNTIGTYTHIDFFVELNTYAAAATGMAIGGAIAYALKADPLVMFSGIVVGSMGYNIGIEILKDGDLFKCTAGPAGSFVAVIVAVEIGMLVSKKTKVDIIVTPFVTVLTGFAVAKLVSPWIARAMYYIGNFINTATELRPILMGIIVSVVVGMVLTLPISSAAICAMIGISGLAGGAAAVGCCCNMIGFAVISFRENKWGGVVAQGLGTSMLQMGNIVKKPQIWISPILSSAVCGVLSTTVFRLKCVGIAAGMGTCGLVGPLGVFNAMTAAGDSAWRIWLGILLLCFVLPAVFTFLFNEILRKIGWVKTGDMQLENT